MTTFLKLFRTNIRLTRLYSNKQNFLYYVNKSKRITWCLTMHNAIKMIRDVEREAKEILDQAKLQADMITQKTENNLPSVYRKAYEEAISEARNRSVELIEETKEKTESLAKNILGTSKGEIDRVQENARNNFDTAVDFIFNEITSSRT